MLEDNYSTEEAEALSGDVAKLSMEGIVDKALCHNLEFEKVSCSTIFYVKVNQ